MRSISTMRAAATFLAALLLTATAGCKDRMCQPGELPGVWKPYEEILPQNVVMCGTTRGPGDLVDSRPEKIFVYFKDKSAHDAWLQTVTQFEGKGWQRSAQSTDAYSKGKFNADFPPWVAFTKGGERNISVNINKNDFGVQGIYEIVSEYNTPL